ncbi:MAG: choice-of-anchor E domain-containing protein [Rhodospirillales bacterium]|nr:choice-of-anchor E domain-containing protein [Rhodospirillales bacterium]
MNSTIWSAATVGAVLALSLGQARADTIVNSSPAYSCAAGVCTQSFATGSQTLDWTSAQNNRQIFNLNLFNPALGSLTAVTLSAPLTIAGPLSYTNMGPTTTVDISSGSALTLTTNGMNAALDTALATLAIDPTISLNVVIDSGETVFAGGLGATGSGTVSGPLSAFTGPGSVSIDASTLTFDSVSGGGGNISVDPSFKGAAVLTVTYDYSVPPSNVPEPLTGAILGSAVVLLGMVRRRTRA